MYKIYIVIVIVTVSAVFPVRGQITNENCLSPPVKTTSWYLDHEDIKVEYNLIFLASPNNFMSDVDTHSIGELNVSGQMLGFDRIYTTERQPQQLIFEKIIINGKMIYCMTGTMEFHGLKQTNNTVIKLSDIWKQFHFMMLSNEYGITFYACSQLDCGYEVTGIWILLVKNNTELWKSSKYPHLFDYYFYNLNDSITIDEVGPYGIIESDHIFQQNDRDSYCSAPLERVVPFLYYDTLVCIPAYISWIRKSFMILTGAIILITLFYFGILMSKRKHKVTVCQNVDSCL